jgi:RNA polymerase sigma factor (sigma-70 family)
MTHEHDAEDARRLASGDAAWLLAKYERRIRTRCRAKLRGHPDAEDVAQQVLVRLLHESRRRRSYPVPYGVVVNKVIDWTVADYHDERPLDQPLPEGWEPSAEDEGYDEVIGRMSIEPLIERLPSGQREVVKLRFVELLEPDEIAERLGIERNAVHQRLHNAMKTLRRLLADG